MITNTEGDGKKGEREIQVTIHIDSVLASFESFWRLHDRASCTEICSVPVKLCPSPLNSGLQCTWMIPLYFFYKWQLNSCRGSYFENTRQFLKLNKLSMSVITIKYNNLKALAFSLKLWEFRAHSSMSEIKSIDRTHDRYHHHQGGESGAEG